MTPVPALHRSGSFAVVKKGIRKTDGAQFAIKFIDKTALEEDDEAMLVSIGHHFGTAGFTRVDLRACASV